MNTTNEKFSTTCTFEEEQSLPWVIVTAAGTKEQTIIAQARSMPLALQVKVELYDPSADVMKRLPSGELTTEF
jgi:hypothetical protein